MSSHPEIRPVGTTDQQILTRLRSELASFVGLDPSGLTAAEARERLAAFVAIGKLADAGVVALAHTVAGFHPTGVGAATRELAASAGVSQAEAERIEATSKVLPDLPVVRQALASGSLSRTQVAVVAEAAASSPGSEAPLLATAGARDLMGLRRHAERVLAEGGNAKRNRERAHANRGLRTWTKNGEWHCHLNGPTHLGAEIALALQPFWDQALRDASKQDREPFGAYGFDAMVAMARAAATGSTDVKVKKRRWQGVVRVDATAIARGHAVEGETVEIAGVGPIDVETATALLGEATVYAMVKRGRDVASIATVTRWCPPTLRLALAEKGDFECGNRDCSNTAFIELDHEDDIAWSFETSYRNGNCLCSRCHDLKTLHSYQITHHPDGTITLEPPDPDPPP